MGSWIKSRSDLAAYLRGRRPAISDHCDVGEVVGQILGSDHPAWGEDWEEWLDEWLLEYGIPDRYSP